MIFFDRSIPKSVAYAFKQERGDVLWLDDVFAQNTPDTEWLPKAGASGWLVICRDKKIRTRPGERREILDNGVGCFILAHKKDLTKLEMIGLLRTVLPKMEQLFANTHRPFIYTIDRAGLFRKYA